MKLNDNASRHISEAVAKICPIDGISTGTGEKLSWRIHFRPEATAEQRVAAQAVVDDFDLSDAAQVTREKAARKVMAAAKLTSNDDVAMAVRSGLNAVRNQLRGNDNALVDKVNEIVSKVNTALGLDIQPLPKFQKLTKDEETAKFLAELEKE